MPYPTMPATVTGLPKTATLTMTATAPLALPSTCSVSGLVNFVTRKLVRLTNCCGASGSCQHHARIRHGAFSQSVRTSGRLP